MQNVSIYQDHRGRAPIAYECHASILRRMRLKQCSREAVTAGRIKEGFVAPSDWKVVPLCKQHSQAPNVIDEGRAVLRELLYGAEANA